MFHLTANCGEGVWLELLRQLLRHQGDGKENETPLLLTLLDSEGRDT